MVHLADRFVLISLYCPNQCSVKSVNVSSVEILGGLSIEAWLRLLLSIAAPLRLLD